MNSICGLKLFYLMASMCSLVQGSCITTEGDFGTCVPLSLCTAHVDDFSKAQCHFDMWSAGICCPSGPPHIDTSKVAFEVDPTVSLRLENQQSKIDISKSMIQRATSAAQNSLQTRDQIEKRLFERGIIVKPGTPEASHQFIQFTSPESLNAARDAFIGRETAAEIASRMNMSPASSANAVLSVRLQDTSLSNICPSDPECLVTKYRSIDGSCNNLRNRNWGRARRAYNRLMTPKYADGIGKPRVATDGSPLPSARSVSDKALRDRNNEYRGLSYMVMIWGQFLAHDLVQTPLHRGINATGIVCCSEEVMEDPSLRHPECFPINIPEDDSFYSKFPGTVSSCMEFVRALDAKPNTCTLSHREQQNQLTAYIDASQVYGSDIGTANRLRANVGGKLKSTKQPNGKDMPPTLTIPGVCQSKPRSGEFCFDFGDTRSTEQPQLGTLHMAFLRQHNKLAEELAKLNPGWNDEILYQESRRIVGCIMQHITYNEFLPVILGRKVMSKFKFLLKRTGFSNDYDVKTDATILNEFGAAAFRFGHSTVAGKYRLLNNGIRTDQNLRDVFLQPYPTNLYDSYIRGAVSQGSQHVDDLMTSDLTTMLFRNATLNAPLGLDLASFNIQRGRDNGIPGYNDVREFCNLKKVSSFNALSKLLINPNVAQIFSRLYKSIDDVDLWVAGISEKPMSGAIVGETFACVISEQFKRLKFGDRFWYERANSETSLSEAQMAEIRKFSLARLLCDNGNNISKMQPLALFKPSNWNPVDDCNSLAIPKMSLAPWKNEPVWS